MLLPHMEITNHTVFRCNVMGHSNVPHIVKLKSPSGFSIGYKGSAPTELALNVLEHAMRHAAYTGKREGTGGNSYFKAALILAPLMRDELGISSSGSNWLLPVQDLDEWFNKPAITKILMENLDDEMSQGLRVLLVDKWGDPIPVETLSEESIELINKQLHLVVERLIEEDIELDTVKITVTVSEVERFIRIQVTNEDDDDDDDDVIMLSNLLNDVATRITDMLDNNDGDDNAKWN